MFQWQAHRVCLPDVLCSAPATDTVGVRNCLLWIWTCSWTQQQQQRIRKAAACRIRSLKIGYETCIVRTIGHFSEYLAVVPEIFNWCKELFFVPIMPSIRDINLHSCWTITTYPEITTSIFDVIHHLQHCVACTWPLPHFYCDDIVPHFSFFLRR